MPHDILPVPRLISFREMQELGINYTKRNIDRLEGRGEFPRRVALSPRRVAWVRQEVLDYLHKKIAERSMLAGTLGSFKKPG